MATILVIDDDVAIRRVLCRMLEKDGHRVLDAAHGGAGLEAAEGEDLDIVITDVFMPGMEGIETIQAFKERSPNLRVLAISGAGADPLIDAELLGADATLAKPFSHEALKVKISALLSG